MERKLDKADFIVLFIAVIFISGCVGVAIGSAMQRNIDIKESIKHGAAHYDSVTGNVEWNK